MPGSLKGWMGNIVPEAAKPCSESVLPNSVVRVAGTSLTSFRAGSDCHVGGPRDMYSKEISLIALGEFFFSC